MILITNAGDIEKYYSNLNNKIPKDLKSRIPKIRPYIEEVDSRLIELVSISNGQTQISVSTNKELYRIILAQKNFKIIKPARYRFYSTSPNLIYSHKNLTQLTTELKELLKNDYININ